MTNKPQTDPANADRRKHYRITSRFYMGGELFDELAILPEDALQFATQAMSKCVFQWHQGEYFVLATDSLFTDLMDRQLRWLLVLDTPKGEPEHSEFFNAFLKPVCCRVG